MMLHGAISMKSVHSVPNTFNTQKRSPQHHIVIVRFTAEAAPERRRFDLRHDVICNAETTQESKVYVNEMNWNHFKKTFGIARDKLTFKVSKISGQPGKSPLLSNPKE